MDYILQIAISTSILSAVATGIFALVNAWRDRNNKWYQHFADRLYGLLESFPDETSFYDDALADENKNRLIKIYDSAIPLFAKKKSGFIDLQMCYYKFISGAGAEDFREKLKGAIQKEICYWLKTDTNI